MLSLQDLVTRVLTRIGTTQALSSTRWPAADIVASLNDGFRDLRQLARDSNTDLFTEVVADAALVKDVAYSLPSTLLRLIDVEDSTGDIGTPLHRFSYSGDAEGAHRLAGHYEVRGNAIILRRYPGRTVNIRYVRDWGDLHYGLCAGEEEANDTTLWLANSAATATGTVVNEADYYNGLIVMIHAGTGLGQYKTVTDHGVSDGGFSYVTTAAWSTKPDATSQYCFLPPWGDAFEEVLLLGAQMRAPIPSWRAEALNNPLYAQGRDNLARWARLQSAGGQQARRSLNDQFATGEL